MGRLLEESGLPELANQLPTLSSTAELAYRSDLYCKESQLFGPMRFYLICRINLLVVVPGKFVM